MPSTGSIFAKPIKQCFTAEPNRIIGTIDFNSLEDKVIASLSRDKNKIITQTDDKLDAHLFHATIYFKDKFEAILGTGMEHRDLTIAAVKAMDEGNKEIKDLRQKSKGVTFGASYGAFPPKIAQTIKCSLEEAEKVFNAYHNDMYPGITKYREQYVLPTAQKQGYLHLGLGCRITTDNPDKDIRTIANASVQYWSILSLLAINKLHKLIDENGLQEAIKVTATIYDSVYFSITNDPEVIAWLNTSIVDLMQTDFMFDQAVPNDAEMEIGSSWADLHKLPHNADVDTITNILKDIQC